MRAAGAVQNRDLDIRLAAFARIDRLPAQHPGGGLVEERAERRQERRQLERAFDSDRGGDRQPPQILLGHPVALRQRGQFGPDRIGIRIEGKPIADPGQRGGIARRHRGRKSIGHLHQLRFGIERQGEVQRRLGMRIAGIGPQRSAGGQFHELPIVRRRGQRQNRGVERERVGPRRQADGDGIESPAPAPFEIGAEPLVGVGLGLGHRIEIHFGDRFEEARTSQSARHGARAIDSEFAQAEQRGARSRPIPGQRSAGDGVEMSGLEIGHQRGGDRAPRRRDAPARPAPAADRGVGQDQQRRFLRGASRIAITEKAVFVERGQRGNGAFGGQRDLAQLRQRIGHDNGAADRGQIYAQRIVRSGEALVGRAFDLALDALGGWIGLGRGGDPGPERRAQRIGVPRLIQNRQIGAGAQIRIGPGRRHRGDERRTEKPRDRVERQAKLGLVAFERSGVLGARFEQPQDRRAVRLGFVDG
ncbi:MAG: hypothetical protein BWZ10_01846 [candidate division BRC1 bacterium ADurb.BinA364]|nr:MAG: hypothetical protein BWZ10_01846 [candidate division BRC1 bacterium ADurb.BinA364]